MAKLEIVKVANALAITTAVFYLVCIIAVWVAPGITTTVGSYLLHGVDISRFVVAGTINFSSISLIIGTIAGWITGALFAYVYNKVN